VVKEIEADITFAVVYYAGRNINITSQINGSKSSRNEKHNSIGLKKRHTSRLHWDDK